MGVVLLLSFTYALSPITAFCMLCAAYCGGITGGSITSILFGIPGEPSAIPTTIEGYALAKQGRAAYALWLFIICSIGGGIFSVLVMMAATPIMANFALRFGPPEFFSLVILGLSVVSSLSGGSVMKGFLACFFGIFLATGRDGRYHGRGAIHVRDGGSPGGDQFRDGHGGAARRVRGSGGGRRALPGVQERRRLQGAAGRASQTERLYEALVPSASFGGHRNGRRIATGGGGATIVSFLAYGDASRSTKHPRRRSATDPKRG